MRGIIAQAKNAEWKHPIGCLYSDELYLGWIAKPTPCINTLRTGQPTRVVEYG